MPNGQGGPAIIVDPFSSGSYYAPAFRERGIPVWAVLSREEPPAPYAGSFRPADFDRVIVFREGDARDVVRTLADARPLCVLAGCEPGVELADRLAPAVAPARGNVPALADARRHKGAMVAALAARNVPTIPTICSRDAGEAASWIARNIPPGARLVVKPPKSVSTDDVYILGPGESWRERFEAIIGKKNAIGIVNDAVVVQRFIDGCEYVVDTVSLDGQHSVVDVCRYHKIDNGSNNPIYDRMEWVPPHAEGVPGLVRYAFSVLDAVGIRNGPGHLEIMVASDGPLLIEVASRPHGGGHPRFCRLATGDSPVDRTVACLASGRLEARSYALRRHLTIVFLMSARDIVVDNAAALRGLSELETHVDSTINVRDGDRVRKTRDLFSSLALGVVALASEDEGRIRDDYDRVRAAERRLGSPEQDRTG